MSVAGDVLLLCSAFTSGEVGRRVLSSQAGLYSFRCWKAAWLHPAGVLHKWVCSGF